MSDTSRPAGRAAWPGADGWPGAGPGPNGPRDPWAPATPWAGPPAEAGWGSPAADGWAPAGSGYPPAGVGQPPVGSGSPTDSVRPPDADGPRPSRAAHGQAIGRYAAPRRPNALIILAAAVAVVVVAAVVIPAVIRSAETPPPAAVSPSTSPTGRTGGVAIDSGGVTGYWAVVSQRWTDNSVTATIEITVDHGLLYYSLYAFGNENAETLEPLRRDDQALTEGYVTAGQPLTGTVTFATRRQDLTLVMFDGISTQISALQIKA